MKIPKDDFEEMVRDYIADNGEKLEDLIIDSTEQIDGTWGTYAHDSKTSYMLHDDGTGNIKIEYLGTV